MPFDRNERRFGLDVVYAAGFNPLGHHFPISLPL
jgi:hypothetical protein